MNKIKIGLAYGTSDITTNFKDQLSVLEKRMVDELDVIVISNAEILIGSCDLLVAIFDKTSTDMGFYLAVHLIAKNKQGIGMAQANTPVKDSTFKMSNSGYKTYRYEDLCDDGFEIIQREVEVIKNSLPSPRPSFSETFPVPNIVGDGH